jgi:hypothetical protein
MFKAPPLGRTRGAGEGELTSSPKIREPRTARGRGVELSLVEFARALGISVVALRRLVLRRLVVGSVEVLDQRQLFVPADDN